MATAEGPRFWDWFACPSCDERDNISTLAYGTDIVFECYDCGLIAEYVIGRDIPVDDFDLDALERRSEELGDSST